MSNHLIDKCGLDYGDLQDKEANEMCENISINNTAELVNNMLITMAFVDFDAAISVLQQAIYKKPTKYLTEKLNGFQDTMVSYVKTMDGAVKYMRKMKATKIVDAIEKYDEVMPKFLEHISKSVKSTDVKVINSAKKELDSIKDAIDDLGLTEYYDEVSQAQASYKGTFLARQKYMNSNKSTAEARAQLKDALYNLVDCVNSVQKVTDGKKDEEGKAYPDHNDLADNITAQYRKYAAIVHARQTRNSKK